MIILNQTSTSLETPKYFSTKSDEVPVIRKTTVDFDREFCTCFVQCVPDLKVFTDETGADELKNDWHSLFIPTVNNPPLSASVITRTVTNIDTGVITTLLDGTHGVLNEGKNYFWFKVSFYDIWNTLGYGRYQFSLVENSNFGGGVINQYQSPVFRLMPYTDKAANGTVRIYSKNKGELHHGNDYSNIQLNYSQLTPDTERIYFEQQTRLPGRFYFKSNEVENDHLVLNNSNLSTYQVKDQLRPTYQLDLHLLSSIQVMPVVFDDLFGSEIYVTDYNVYNHVVDPRNYQANQYVNLPVRREGMNLNNPSATSIRKTYSFDMAYEYDNIYKTNN